MSDVELMDKDEIVEVWGEGFEELAGFDVEMPESRPAKDGKKNARVHFFSDRIEVDLKAPVTLLDGETTSTLTIVEPRSGDLRAMDSVKGDVAKAMSLLCAVGNVKASDVSNMKASDFMLLQQVIGGFL